MWNEQIAERKYKWSLKIQIGKWTNEIKMHKEYKLRWEINKEEKYIKRIKEKNDKTK